MVIATVLYAAMQTIITLLFSGALWISQKILDSSITVFSEGDNIIQNFINLLPFPETLNISGIIFGIADALLILIFAVTMIKSYTSAFTGESSSNALQIIMRCTITLLLSKLIFGSNVLGFNGLLGYFGQWFGTVLSNVSPSISTETLAGVSFGVDLDVATYIGQLVLAGALMASVIGAAISYLERILSFAVSVIFGPIFITLNASSETSDTCKQWILSLFTQFAAILLSLVMWSLFMNKVNSLPRIITDSGTYIFDLAVAIVLLNLMKNSEKIFSAFGLRTMPNTDSARSILAGFGALGAGLMLTRTASTFIGRGHSSGAVAGSVRETGRDNLFENGNLSSADNSVGAKSWAYAKSWNPLIGNKSTRGLSASQNKAIDAINVSMKDAEVGSSLQNISSATVNEAIRGIDGAQGFNYESSELIKANVGQVEGIVGDATYINRNGEVDAIGKYFMPTANYDSSSMVAGTSVEMGDDKSWVLTGESQIIDNSGSRAYQIKAPEPMNVHVESISENIKFEPSSAGAQYDNIFSNDLPKQEPKAIEKESIFAPSDEIAKQFASGNKG